MEDVCLVMSSAHPTSRSFISGFAGVKQLWGPTTGWILTTISFGFTSWIILLVLGWRPAFFKS
jgi:hypothetical protein